MFAFLIYLQFGQLGLLYMPSNKLFINSNVFIILTASEGIYLEVPEYSYRA